MNNTRKEKPTDMEQAASENQTDALSRLRLARTMLHATVGQVVLAMSAVPRYRHQTLTDLSHLVIDPLVRDRVAIANAGQDGDPKTALAPAAVAIWATVSPEVEEKIKEQIKAKVFPVRMKPDDWNSGSIVWLIDVIAPSRELATAVLVNFQQVAKADSIKIHPFIRDLVDPEVLNKLSSKADQEPVDNGNNTRLN